jgi:hypothetical protein
MTPLKCYPKWVDVPMSDLLRDGLMEESGVVNGKPVFRMSKKGLVQQKRVLDDMYQCEFNKYRRSANDDKEQVSLTGFCLLHQQRVGCLMETSKFFFVVHSVQ